MYATTVSASTTCRTWVGRDPAGFVMFASSFGCITLFQQIVGSCESCGGVTTCKIWKVTATTLLSGFQNRLLFGDKVHCGCRVLPGVCPSARHLPPRHFSADSFPILKPGRNPRSPRPPL